MNYDRPSEPALGISLADIYFILFRHKRVIVLLTLIGLVAGTAYYFTQPPPYQSSAKLLIRYVTDRGSNPGDEKGARVTTTLDMGQSVVNSEAAILDSYDLCLEVATNVGPEKILLKKGGGKDATRAADVVKGGLKIAPGLSDGIITLIYTHPDPDVVKPVLEELIRDYVVMHERVHSTIGLTDETLQDQVNQLRLAIAQTDDEIRIAKTNAGIVDVTEAKKNYSDEIARIRSELLQGESELAGRAAEQAEKSALQTNKATTNAIIANAGAVAPLPELARYKTAVSRLSFFEKKEDEYLYKLGYTEQNKLVIEVRENIAQVTKTKTDLEAKYPSLLEMGIQPTDVPSAVIGNGQMDAPHNYSPQRVKVLQMQLASIQAEAVKLDAAEAVIEDLTRKKNLQESHYKNFASTLDDTHIKETLGSDRAPGINSVQSPTPPMKNMAKYYKVVGGLMFSGLLAGIAWAFLFELFLDRTVKRASEIESKLNLPFFLAIPEITRTNQKQLAAPTRLQLGNGKPGSDLVPVAELEPHSALVNNALNLHYDALRDRLVLYFESINLTRKPKLVAVTSAGRGAGVSTIASGLAASLSETGDGRVLLVDMNQEHGGAQQFFNGKANCKLDDALLRDKRDEALVQDRLYVVSEGSQSDKLSRVLPKRFAALVPQLKASDYDYIIFDMPPVSQTSVTTRLAGFMDTVMLVVESEKTERDVVEQASKLLAHSKANVTTVLNKTKQHVPRRLVHDINARG